MRRRKEWIFNLKYGIMEFGKKRLGNWVDGRTVLLGTIYDVSDRKLYQQKIERQANNDMLIKFYLLIQQQAVRLPVRCCSMGWCNS